MWFWRLSLTTTKCWDFLPWDALHHIGSYKDLERKFLYFCEVLGNGIGILIPLIWPCSIVWSRAGRRKGLCHLACLAIVPLLIKYCLLQGQVKYNLFKHNETVSSGFHSGLEDLPCIRLVWLALSTAWDELFEAYGNSNCDRVFIRNQKSKLNVIKN